MDRSDRARPKAPRRPVVLALVWILIALPAAAWASLPDASWVPGVYDDADDDAALLAAVSLQGSLALCPPVLEGVPAPSDPVPAPTPARRALVSVVPTGIRAPPTS